MHLISGERGGVTFGRHGIQFAFEKMMVCGEIWTSNLGLICLAFDIGSSRGVGWGRF